MSTFEVYLVMQLDIFRVSLMAIGILLIGAALFFFFAAVDSYNNDEKARLLNLARKCGIAILSLAFLLLFTPDSKTLAAMYIVPALTSKDVVEPVGKEVKEVYDLAKKALKNLAEDKDEDRSK